MMCQSPIKQGTLRRACSSIPMHKKTIWWKKLDVPKNNTHTHKTIPMHKKTTRGKIYHMEKFARFSRSRKQRKKPSASQHIIAALLEEAALLAWIFERPAQFRSVYIERGLSREEWERLRSDAARKQALRDLKRRAKLEVREAGNRILCRLSADAVVGRLKDIIRATTKKLPRGERCLVLFDVPVGANAVRNFWRHFLVSADFQRDQLSAWVTDKDVQDAVRALVRLLKAERWVHVYRILP